MEIRELTESDLHSLLALYIELDEDNTNLSVEKSKQIWEEVHKNPNIIYIGAVDKGIVVSSCYIVIIPNLTNKGKSIGFIENVVTDKGHRNQGLAKNVIQKAIEIAQKNNCYKVILQSGVKRENAHKLYEKLGFNGETKKAFDLRLAD